jgi:single-strand DNA-binding protein
LIEGRLQQDKWDDKETGQKRSKLKVVADAMQLLGGRTEGGAPGTAGGGNPPAKTGAPRPAASPSRGNDSYADADSGRTPDQSFYDDMPSSGGDDVPF